VAQVAVCSQINTKHINTVWAELTVVKIFNLLVHPVTSRLQNVEHHAPKNNPKENIQHSKHGESLKSRSGGLFGEGI
jgi:NMD protein affecting ribosome stability and mRNA decay